MKLTTFFLLFTSLLFSQEGIYPFDALIPIEIDIGLLPDKKSYYVTEEYYHNDTLTKSSIEQVFYNYGNLRILIYANEYNNSISNNIVTQQIHNDTVTIQTSRRYAYSETGTDSLTIYRKEGRIYKIIHWHNNSLSNSKYIEYKNGKPVMETTKYVDGRSGITTMNYEKDKLIYKKTLDSDGTLETSEFTYTDSLTTCINKIYISGKVYITNSQCKYNALGNILLTKKRQFIEDDADSVIYEINKYTYGDSGQYTQLKTRPLTGSRQEMDHFPGTPKIEKYFWPNENSRMTKTYIQMDSN